MAKAQRLSLGQRLGFDRFSGVYLGVLFIVVFGVLQPELFLSLTTFRTIASQQAVGGMLALALIVPIAAGAFDLSVGATINIVAVVVAILQVDHGMSPGMAILVGLAIGLAIGVVNGFIVVKLQVESLIATLGTGSIILAFQIMISPTQPLNPTSPFFVQLANRTVLGFQVVIVYFLILAFLTWWLLERSTFGRSLYAVGGNADAARLSGLRVGRLTWLSLVFSGGISGLAGVFYASQFGPSLTFGPSLLLPAFAAVFLGSTQLRPGRFNVWGTLLSIYVLAIGVQGLDFVYPGQWIGAMFNGVALIGAVALAASRRGAPGRGGRRRSRRVMAADRTEVLQETADA